MESTLISVVSLALIIIGSVTMALSSLISASTVSDSWKDMEELSSEIRKTEIEATLSGNYTGGNINLMVANEGQTNLASFSKWDVIARYQNGNTEYIAYTATYPPGNDRWTVEGIYLSDNTSNAEVFDPNILNPDETMKVIIDLDPVISQGNTGRITISTPNGVTSQCLVTRQ